MKLHEGSIRTNGEICYSDLQDPIFVGKATLRENIIMDELFERARYEDILQEVSLDVHKFDGGD